MGMNAMRSSDHAGLAADPASDLRMRGTGASANRPSQTAYRASAAREACRTGRPACVVSTPVSPVFVVRLVLPILLALSVAAPCLHAESVQTLADGRRVTVIDVIEVAPEAGERTLILEYRTELDLGDRAALDAEVDAVWQSFRATVEAAGVSTAAIKAMAPPTGFLRKRSRAWETYVYWKSAAGEWSRR
jgi:hypothetical protein